MRFADLLCLRIRLFRAGGRDKVNIYPYVFRSHSFYDALVDEFAYVPLTLLYGFHDARFAERLRSDTEGRSPGVVCAVWFAGLSGLP